MNRSCSGIWVHGSLQETCRRSAINSFASSHPGLARPLPSITYWVPHDLHFLDPLLTQHNDHSFVSPRKRAQRTFELLNLGLKDLPWRAHGQVVEGGCGQACNARIEITQDIREWDYGDYEGITSAEIRSMRREQGLDEHWDIWSDGCPGGE